MWEIRPIDQENRARVNAFIMEHWFSTQMAVRGESVELDGAPGFFAEADGALIGLITYRVQGDALEVLSLDSLRENKGLGTALLDAALAEARRLACRRISLITTNDNIKALRFYQKRGFDIVGFYPNALDASRRLKPEIPLIGLEGIPLRHEFELERVLS